MNTIFSQIFHALQQRSVQTLLVLTVYVAIAGSLPFTVHQGFYTVSLFIKDILLWIMPVTVGFFIAHTVQAFERRAPFFILILLIFEAFSNFGSVWYAFICAHVASEFLPSFGVVTFSHHFEALWSLPWVKPSWWSAEKGAIVGLILGTFNAFNQSMFLRQVIGRGKTIVEWLLSRVFARFIPFFILGFAAQMYQMKLLNHIFAHYAMLVVWLIVFLSIYITFLFVLGAGISLRNIVRNIKNLLPAGGIALTSGCSLSTMPWTIEGTAKNLKTPQIAKAIIPATTNIQQVGDCIANTFLCFLIYRHFYGQNPELITWIHFSIVFVLARFATAAVIGGAIFIMLPIYEQYLGFKPEMIAIILALNVVLDPLITCCNVMANGALCRVFERVWIQAQALATSLRKAIQVARYRRMVAITEAEAEHHKKIEKELGMI